MRYTTKQYALALFAALKNKSAADRKEIIKRFLIILRKNRDGARLKLILQETERQHLKDMGLKKVEVVSAGGLSSKVKKEMGEILGGKILWQESVESKLLAGLRILIDEENLIDASASRFLNKIFVKS